MKIIFALFVLLTNACLAQVNLQAGLSAYYPFSGNAKDESGNNNHPVFNNARLTADRFGKPKSAYHFNGQNTYIKILNSPSLNTKQKLSICAWVKPQGFYTGKCHGNAVLMKGDADYLAGNYCLRFDDNQSSNGNNCYQPVDKTHQNFYGINAYFSPPGYTPYIKTDQWYSVVVTYDGTTARLYIDCKLISSKPQGNITFTNKYDLFIGRLNDDNYPYWLTGDLDEIRIYNRPLNKKEILALCDYKPAVKEPPYVKAKEKKKEVVPHPKKQVDKSGTASTKLPLITISKQQELKAGFIKLSTYENQQEVILQERKMEITKEIAVDGDSLSVTLYDNGDIDGDSITLIYNDKILTTHQRLTDKPLTFFIKIASGVNARNDLVMYAENLGSIPPNTALMVIYDGKKRYELNIKSTEKTNGSVSFKLRE